VHLEYDKPDWRKKYRERFPDKPLPDEPCRFRLTDLTQDLKDRLPRMPMMPQIVDSLARDRYRKAVWAEWQSNVSSDLRAEMYKQARVWYAAQTEEAKEAHRALWRAEAELMTLEQRAQKKQRRHEWIQIPGNRELVREWQRRERKLYPERVRARSRKKYRAVKVNPKRHSQLKKTNKARIARIKADPVKGEEFRKKGNAATARWRERALADPVKAKALRDKAKAWGKKRYADPKKRADILKKQSTPGYRARANELRRARTKAADPFWEEKRKRREDNLKKYGPSKWSEKTPKQKKATTKYTEACRRAAMLKDPKKAELRRSQAKKSRQKRARLKRTRQKTDKEWLAKQHKKGEWARKMGPPDYRKKTPEQKANYNAYQREKAKERGGWKKRVPSFPF